MTDENTNTRFVIENVESEQTMDSPKGSSRLPKLLSRVPTSLRSIAGTRDDGMIFGQLPPPAIDEYLVLMKLLYTTITTEMSRLHRTLVTPLHTLLPDWRIKDEVC